MIFPYPTFNDPVYISLLRTSQHVEVYKYILQLRKQQNNTFQIVKESS